MDQRRFFLRGQALQCEERPPDAASGAVAASSPMDRRGRSQSHRARGEWGSLSGPRKSDAQKTYDDSLRKAGRNPKDFSAAQLHFTYVGRTTDEAWAHSQDHLHYMITWYTRWLAEANENFGAGQPRPAGSFEACATPRACFRCWSAVPNEVAAKLNHSFGQSANDASGARDASPGIAPERSRRSMELFAREVAPQLKPSLTA